MKKLPVFVAAGLGAAAAACFLYHSGKEEVVFRDLLPGLTTGPNPEEVLHRIAERATKLVGGTAGYVERVDIERNEVIAAAVYDGLDLPAAGTRGPYMGSLAEQVIQTGRMTIVRDVRRES